MSTSPDIRRPLPSRRALVATAALLVAFLLLPAAAAHAEGPTFALKPSPETESGYFELSGRPGQTLRGQVEVTNTGERTGSTRLYAVDATTGQTSGAVYRSEKEPKRTVGRWTQINPRSVTLEPGESQLVSFSVQVPDGLEPGQYLGGIVAQRFNKTVKAQPGDEGEGEGEDEESTGFQVKVRALSVLAVEVNVPGPQHPAMTLSGIKPGGQPGHQALLLRIGNSGNVLLKGTGSLKVVNRGGRKVQKQDFALDTFVPDTKIEYPVYVEGKALPPGRYRGTVSLTYRGHHLTRRFPFRITAADTEQVFGETGSQNGALSSSSSSSSDNAVIYILIAVCALSLATAFYFWRHRRPV